jgi:hypothetical protein
MNVPATASHVFENAGCSWPRCPTIRRSDDWTHQAFVQQKSQAPRVDDDGAVRADPVNVFFAFQDELRRSPVRFDLPFARLGEARNGHDSLDDRDEVAAGKFIFEQFANRGWRVGQLPEPRDFVS